MYKMYKMTQHAPEMREAFDLEADGLKADEPRNRAEWARMIAAEIRKQGMARSKEVLQENTPSRPATALKKCWRTSWGALNTIMIQPPKQNGSTRCPDAWRLTKMDF
jgi:hypothetical protein